MSVNILGKEYDIATTTELDLSYKNLTEIPESVFLLTNLQYLYLHYNNLTYIPESFSVLTKLHYLQLSYNNLTSLPESIGSLSNLKTLHLRDNNLTSLPESIKSLSNLEYLYLYNNNLTSISESIQTFTKIENFVLDESSYDINNLSMDCHTLILTDIDNNITNLPPLLRTLYLKSDRTDVDMIKLPYGCDIIRF